MGAHIHRVADIQKNNSLNDIKKGEQIVNGDNGFWLCSNHDKLFEYGLIYFINNKLKINSKILEKNEITFVNKMTSNFLIVEEHYTPNIKKFLAKHRARFKKYERK